MSVCERKGPWVAWMLPTLAACIAIVAGCAPSGPSGGLKTERKSLPPPPPVERGSSMGRRPSMDSSSGSTRQEPVRKSPQQIAALHRVDSARVLIEEGRYRRAISELEKTLTLDATNPRVYFYLARAHYELSHFRESLDFLEVTESFMDGRSVSRTEVLVLQGDNLRSLGRPAEARQHYERALAIDPGNEDAMTRLRSLSRQS